MKYCVGNMVINSLNYSLSCFLLNTVYKINFDFNMQIKNVNVENDGLK